VVGELDKRQIDSYIVLFGAFNFFYCYYNIMRGDWLGTAVGLVNFLALIYFGANMKNPEWMKAARLD